MESKKTEAENTSDLILQDMIRTSGSCPNELQKQIVSGGRGARPGPG